MLALACADGKLHFNLDNAWTWSHSRDCSIRSWMQMPLAILSSEFPSSGMREKESTARCGRPQIEQRCQGLIAFPAGPRSSAAKRSWRALRQPISFEAGRDTNWPLGAQPSCDRRQMCTTSFEGYVGIDACAGTMQLLHLGSLGKLQPGKKLHHPQ